MYCSPNMGHGSQVSRAMICPEKSDTPGLREMQGCGIVCEVQYASHSCDVHCQVVHRVATREIA